MSEGLEDSDISSSCSDFRLETNGNDIDWNEILDDPEQVQKISDDVAQDDLRRQEKYKQFSKRQRKKYLPNVPNSTVGLVQSELAASQTQPDTTSTLLEVQQQAIRKVQKEMPTVYLWTGNNLQEFKRADMCLENMSLFPRNLKGASDKVLLESVERLVEIFSHGGAPSQSIHIQELMNHFFPGDLSMPIDVISNIASFYKMQYLHLFIALCTRPSLKFKEDKTLQKQMCVIIDRINLLAQRRLIDCRLNATFHPSYGPLFSVFSHISHNESLNENHSDYQGALYAVLGQCHLEGLRRKGAHLYKPRLVDGKFSHAYIKWKTCQEYVNGLMEHAHTTELFEMLTKARNTSCDIVKFLESCSCVALPTLVTNSLWASCLNGCYSLEEDRLYAFDDMPAGIVCGKIFNLDIDIFDHMRGGFLDGEWRNIPNTAMSEIFDTQWRDIDDPQIECRVPQVELVKLYNLAMLGRCLYPLNYKDRFQKHYILIGEMGTGKSMIADAIESMFQPGDVMTVSPLREFIFGLPGIMTKDLWIMREMNENVSWEEGEWCSVTGGEKVEVKEKFVTSYAAVCETPGLTFGNKFGFRKNKKTGIPRRMFYGIFKYLLLESEKKDDLHERLAKEVTINLVKLNRAYLTMLEYFKENNITNFDQAMPFYYRYNRDAYVRSVDSIEGFLNSKYVKLGDQSNLCVPEQALKDQYYRFCRDNSLPKQSWAESSYASAFAKYKVFRSSERETKDYPRDLEFSMGFSEAITDYYVYGIDIILDLKYFEKLQSYNPNDSMLDRISRGIAQQHHIQQLRPGCVFDRIMSNSKGQTTRQAPAEAPALQVSQISQQPVQPAAQRQEVQEETNKSPNFKPYTPAAYVPPHRQKESVFLSKMEIQDIVNSFDEWIIDGHPAYLTKKGRECKRELQAYVLRYKSAVASVRQNLDEFKRDFDLKELQDKCQVLTGLGLK